MDAHGILLLPHREQAPQDRKRADVWRWNGEIGFAGIPIGIRVHINFKAIADMVSVYAH